MRLSTFHARAETTFPTACDELEGRRDGLENSWSALEKDAESLRRELGEDRWVLVFRGAGRQANKMYESVGRSLTKLQEALDSSCGGTQAANATTLGQKIENYETKKTHYGPAIERVLGIIEKGVQDRLTVNGEIVRLHSEMQGKWEELKTQMAELDKAVEAAQVGQREQQQLRDSVSSLMSNDRSTVGSAADTPGSSPASSVIMSNLTHGTDPTTPGKAGKPRPSATGLPQRSTPLSGSHARRNLSAPRSSGYGKPTYTPTPASREASATPTGNRIPRLSFSSASMAARPRWNSSVKTEEGLTGHNFKPLSISTPSPYARGATPTGGRNASFAERAHERSGSASKIPLRRSLGGGGGGESPGSPVPGQQAQMVTTPLPTRTKNLSSFRDRMGSPSPGPYAQQNLLSSSSPGLAKAGRRLSVQPSPGAGGGGQQRSASRRA
ncbi:hypothetical protein V492_08155, partial [Pseudogymnoascus sp. VKM F-4246]